MFLSLMPHLDIAAICHGCVLWEETPPPPPTCIPPDFNSSMLAIWEELWHSMPQSGWVSITVKSLLQTYKERYTAKRKRPRHSSESPAPLLPVSFSLVKDWLLKQQKAQSEALQTGTVNEDTQEVIGSASPVVPPLVMSLGPERVTDCERAEEHAEE